MRKIMRCAVACAAGVAALAFTGSAFAAFSPKLTVHNGSGAAGSGGAGGVKINVTAPATDDPVYRVAIYVPNGYQLNSPNPGTTIGDVAATAQAADLGGATLPLTGSLQVLDPKTATPTALAQCGVTTIAALWNLHLTAAGQTLDVPLYVVQTSGAETALGQFKLVVCLPPPDVPQGTPGRATFGAKLLAATFTANAFTNPPATGDYRWRALWTPYTPAKGTPNAAGSVETQSIVHIPTQLVVSAKKKVTTRRMKSGGKARTVHTTTALVTIRLTEGVAGNGISGANVILTVNGRRFKLLKTGSSGTATAAVRVAKRLTFGATAGIPDRDLGAAGCTAPAFGVPCTNATVGAQTVTSRTSATVTAVKP